MTTNKGRDTIAGVARTGKKGKAMGKRMAVMACLLLASCGPVGPVEKATGPKGTTKAAAAAPVEPEESKRFQGRTASEWNRDLLDTDYRIGQAGAFALGQLDEEGVPYLVNGLTKASQEVQPFILLALSDKGMILRPHAKKAVPGLTPWLAKGSESDNFLAAKILGAMGPAAAAAIPALEKAAKNGGRAGTMAKESLKNIRAK